MNCNDLYLGRIRGGAFFKKDFMFKKRIEENASLCLEYVGKNKLEFDVSIDDNKIILKKESGEIQISDEDVRFGFGKVKVNDILIEDGLYKNDIVFLDYIINNFKNMDLFEIVGINPIFAIPYIDLTKNIVHLSSCVDKMIINNGIITSCDNTFKFDLSFGGISINGGSVFFEISNAGTNTLLSVDFKVKINSFLKSFIEVFSKNNVNYLFEMIKKITNNFEGVDIELLKNGNKD